MNVAQQIKKLAPSRPLEKGDLTAERKKSYQIREEATKSFKFQFESPTTEKVEHEEKIFFQDVHSNYQQQIDKVRSNQDEFSQK